jgi:hypothetical protein
MNPNNMPPSQLPSHRLLPVGSLAPFAFAALAAAITGVNVWTAFGAVLGTLIPMIAARTFLLALDLRPDRSPLRAEFDLMWDTPNPNRFQHWYVPVIGAGAAGAGAEFLRTVISFVRVGAPLSRDIALGAASVGALEGLFIVLTLALGFGVSSVILTPRGSLNGPSDR